MKWLSIDARGVCASVWNETHDDPISEFCFITKTGIRSLGEFWPTAMLAPGCRLLHSRLGHDVILVGLVWERS
ncbi:UNVERIFIED_CONTAM: hypothetical protein Sangu_3202100 [Sesamum angustifolium]|uniref:Uncharacterized protein n=1 Tax=Sesamum angustifolium TaxID=2727405 RepID=A0AAW2JLT9_9LAMI